MITDFKTIEYYANEIAPKVFKEEVYKDSIKNLQMSIKLYRKSLDIIKENANAFIENDTLFTEVNIAKVTKKDVFNLFKALLSKELNNATTSINESKDKNSMESSISFRFDPIGSIYGSLFNLAVIYLNNHED